MLASRIKCLTYSSFHEAYGSDGARGRSSHSKSPGRPPYASNLHNSYDGHNQSMGGYRNDGWDIERRGSDMQSGHQFEYPAFPKTLDELELDYTREAMELGRIRDKEEDEENYKHREVCVFVAVHASSGYCLEQFCTFLFIIIICILELLDNFALKFIHG